MSDDEAVAAAAILFSLNRKLDTRKKAKRKRTMWTKPWICNRLCMAAYHALVQELKETDNQGFANFLRMDMESFELLLQRVAPLIARQDTRLRLSIQPEERLALTLRNVNKQAANHSPRFTPVVGTEIHVEHALRQNRLGTSDWYQSISGTSSMPHSPVYWCELTCISYWYR